MIEETKLSRRSMLKWLGLGAASVAVASCAGTPAAAPTTAPAPAAPAAPAATAAGGAPAAAATKPAGSPPPATTPTKITFLYADGPPIKDKMDLIVQNFMAKNKSIQVETIWTAWSSGGQAGFEQKVPAMYAGGNPPDYHQCDDDAVPAFAFKDMLRPVDDIISAQLTKSDYPKMVWDLVTAKGGKSYGLCLALKPRMFFYNTEMFTAAGIKAPTKWEDAWTADEFLANAKKLTKGDIFGTTWDYWWWDSLYVDNKGMQLFDEKWTKFLLPETGGDKPLQWVADLAYKEKVAPPYDVQTSIGNRPLFISKKVAMYSGIVSDVQVLNQSGLKYDAMPYPKSFDEARSEASLFNFTLRKDAPDAAIQLAVYTLSDEAQSIMAFGSDLMPTKMSQWTNPIFSNANVNPKEKHLFWESLDRQARWPFLVNGIDLRDAMRPEMDLVWAGQKTATAALAACKSKVEELLKITAANCGRGCA